MVQELLYENWAEGYLLPGERGGIWARHVFRELNALADAVTTDTLLSKSSQFTMHEEGATVARRAPDNSLLRLRASWDGGVRGRFAAGGWCIQVADEQREWHIWFSGGRPAVEITAIRAELLGVRELITILDRLCRTEAVEEMCELCE